MIGQFKIQDISVDDSTTFATLVYTDQTGELIVSDAVVVTHWENIMSEKITVKDVIRSLRIRVKKDVHTLDYLMKVLQNYPSVFHFLLFGKLS